MEIRQIIYFLEVAKAGTFSAAAKTLYISQPALSKAVKNLEQELGTKLFVQVDNKTTLTDVGRVLYDKSQVLIDNYNALIDAVGEVADKNRGWIRIGIPYGLGSMLFYRLVSDFSERYPNVEIIVSGHGSRYIRELVAESKVDIGITIIPPEIDSRLKSESIISDRYFLMVNNSHPLAGRESVSFKELQDETFIMLNDEFATTEVTKGNCQAAGFSPKVNITANRSDFIAGLVAENRGIAVIAGGRWRFQNMKGVHTLSLEDGRIDFEIAMVTQTSGYLPVAAQKFIDYAKDHGKAVYNANTEAGML